MEEQECDDSLQMPLPFSKIDQIIFLDSSLLLVIHSSNHYAILPILPTGQLKIIKEGVLPPLVEDIARITTNSICFILGHELQIFDLIQQKVRHSVGIHRSQIYSQQWRCDVFYRQKQLKILFYKISVLKSVPVTVYYDLNLYSLRREALEKIKRVKSQYQDIRQFRYSCGEIVGYQVAGYDIQVCFIESGITHRINSIYHLFMVQAVCTLDDIHLQFAYEELENQVMVYQVNQKRAKKGQRRKRDSNSMTIYDSNGLRQLSYKNRFTKGDQSKKGLLKVNFRQSSKYLGLMEVVFPQWVGLSLRYETLNLLL